MCRLQLICKMASMKRSDSEACDVKGDGPLSSITPISLLTAAKSKGSAGCGRK